MPVDRQRRVPERHDGVADVLVDGAAVLLDDHGHGREIAAEQGGESLRVVLVALREGGEGPDIAEHDGELAALAADLQGSRAGRQPIDHHRRQIAAEGVADGAAAGLLPDVAGHGEPEQQDAQGTGDVDAIDQDLVVTKGIPSHARSRDDHERQQRR